MVMNDVPEYLKRLRQAQEERARRAEKAASTVRPGISDSPPYSAQEQEAIRWARQVAGATELRSIRSLAGARFAVLVRLQSATGARFISLEGLPNRDVLRERVKPGATVGEEVLGAYEIKGGRPVTIVVEEGQVVLKMGAPRAGGGAPVSPGEDAPQGGAAGGTAGQVPEQGRRRRGALGDLLPHQEVVHQHRVWWDPVRSLRAVGQSRRQDQLPGFPRLSCREVRRRSREWRLLRQPGLR